ncbi:MAG: trigger factor [Lachnospiraceae bacterium]|nr:trigger factor [Lachnospiraceae bacterium]
MLNYLESFCSKTLIYTLILIYYVCTQSYIVILITNHCFYSLIHFTNGGSFKMKKFKMLVLAIGIILTLTGCSGSSDESGNGDGYDTGDTELDDALAAMDAYNPTDFVELGEYKGVPVNVYVSDDEIDGEIMSIISENSSFEQIKKGKVKDGNTVNIDFTGKMNGEEFEGGSSKGFALEIGSNSFIDGFEEGLIGVAVGETVSLNLSFPDPYPNSPDLAGKPVTFDVTVNYIQGDAIVPEFDDKFVKEYTKDEYKTVDEYKEVIKDNIIEEKRSTAGDTAFNTVLSTSKVIECPDYLVNIMKLRLDATNRAMATSNGYNDFNKFLTEVMQYTEEQYNEELISTATSYAEQKLIAEAIAAKENITVTEEEYNEQLASALSSTGNATEEELDKFMVETYRSRAEDMINESVLMQKVIQFVKDNCTEVTTPPAEDNPDDKDTTSDTKSDAE